MLKSSSVSRFGRLLMLILLVVVGLSAADTVTDAEQSFIKEHMNSDDRVVLKQAFDKYNQDHAVQGADRNLALQAGYVAVRKAQTARGLVMPGAEPAKQPDAAPTAAAADAPAAPASADVAAKLKEVEDNLAKLHAAEEVYQKDVLAARDAFMAKNMEFLATLNLKQLSDKLPPDPRASDMQRRDRIRALNNFMLTYAATLDEWRTTKSLEVPAGAKKPKPFLDSVSLRSVFDGHDREAAFFKLYRELKIESVIPEVKPDTLVVDPRKKQ